MKLPRFGWALGFEAGELNDFSKLSPPDPDLVTRNAERLASVKATMGDKYLLAKPIERKQS